VCSGRQSTGAGLKKGRRDEEEDDLTADMEDPTPETNIQEVPLSKTCEYCYVLGLILTFEGYGK